MARKSTKSTTSAARFATWHDAYRAANDAIQAKLASGPWVGTEEGEFVDQNRHYVQIGEQRFYDRDALFAALTK